MKKKAIPPFTMTAGQTGRLLFNFTLPEGTAKPALRGALMVHGQKVDMLTGDDDTLTIPPLPAGIYLTEVRAAGICILYGHVEVLPSPLFEDTGVAAYKVDVDSSTDLLRVNLSMVEGIPGMQGAQGIQGEKGDTGASAYQLAVQYGYAGTEADWIAELQGAQAAANSAKASEQSATSAASSATNAQHAAEASADSAAQHATRAEADAAKLGDAALKSQNNTFSGTNTFNGVIAANGGITGLPALGTGSNAVCANAMGLLSLVETGLTQRIHLTWGTPVGNMTVTNGELFTAPQNKTGYVRAAAARPYGLHSINIGLFGDFFIPLKMSIGTNNAHVRVDVLFTLGGWSYNEQPTGWPLDLATLDNERGSAGISLEVHRDTSWSAARVILRAVGYTGAETTSGLTVTEREYNVQRTNYNPFFVGNQLGLLGVLLARDTEDKNKMAVLLLCGWDSRQVVYRLATIPFGLSNQGGHTLRLQVASSNTGTVYLPCLYYRNRCGVADVFVDAATALGAKELSSVATTITDISAPLADYIANTTANE